MTIRIAHFTDLHVTEPPADIAWKDLTSKRLIGWLNLKLGGRHEAMSDAVRIGRAFVEDVLDQGPDHILFTGDVTGLSLPSEFERAHAVLEKLVEARNVTGIPGNHDVYVKSAVRHDFFDRWFGSWLQTDLRRRDLPGNLQTAYPWPVVRHVADEATIVCLLDSRRWLLGPQLQLQRDTLEHAALSVADTPNTAGVRSAGFSCMSEVRFDSPACSF